MGSSLAWTWMVRLHCFPSWKGPVILPDVNVLVYAHREDTPNHTAYREWLESVINSDQAYGIADLVLSGFLRVVTHPRVFDPPTELEVALEDLDCLLASPSLVLLGPGPGHASHLRHVIEEGRATGNLAHDAHIAALLVEHGVRELWTLDRDFARFSGLRIVDPLS